MDIRVTLADPNGRSGPAILPDHVEIRRLIPALIHKLNLPTTTKDGMLLKYSLTYPDGLPLVESHTLNSAKIEHETILYLQVDEIDIDVYDLVEETDLDLGIRILGTPAKVSSSGQANRHNNKWRIVGYLLLASFIFSICRNAVSRNYSPSLPTIGLPAQTNNDDENETIINRGNDISAPYIDVNEPIPDPTPPSSSGSASALLDFELLALGWVIEPAEVVVVEGQAYFTAVHPETHSMELWRTDGTPENTVPITTFDSSEGSRIVHLTAVRNQLFFIRESQNLMTEFWITDGTVNGTKLLRTINSNLSELIITHFTVMGDKLFFVAVTNEEGRELWHTNGTVKGTYVVKDIYYQGWASPLRLTVVNNHLYFTAFNGNTRDLWRTDGTAEGTIKIDPTVAPVNDSTHLAELNGRLLLIIPSTTDKISTNSLQIEEEQVELVQIELPAVGVRDSVFVDGGIFIATSLRESRSLWFTDGDEIHLIEGIGNNFSRPTTLLGAGDRAYFPMYVSAYGEELWHSNGLSEPILVKDITENGNSVATPLLFVNGNLYFLANDGRYGSELWVTNGEPDTAVMVSNIGQDGHSIRLLSTATTDKGFYFVTQDEVEGNRLWQLQTEQ